MFLQSFYKPIAEPNGQIVSLDEGPRAVMSQEEKLLIHSLHILIGQAKESLPRKAPPTPVGGRSYCTQSLERS
jgi:hypothetical protein